MRTDRATLNPLLLGLAFEGKAPDWIMLFPAGAVKAVDGRAWANSDPQAVVAESMAAGLDLAIDWEHGQDIKAPDGDAAPAAGWIDQLEVREGAIFAHVTWTEEGRRSVESRGYRYISPSFLFDKTSGLITRIVGAGLVNRPALSMPALARKQEGSEMDKAIAEALGLPATATAAEAVAAIGKLNTNLAQATARAETPDVSRFIPKAQYDAVLVRATAAETKLAEQDRAVKDAEVVALVDQAVKDGKVAPASRDFYLATCRREGGVEEFKRFVASAPKIVADPGVDRDPKAPAGTLSDTEKALARQLGLDEAAYLKTKQEEAA